MGGWGFDLLSLIGLLIISLPLGNVNKYLWYVYLLCLFLGFAVICFFNYYSILVYELFSGVYLLIISLSFWVLNC